MTCIVALRKDGVVYMAGDSAGVAGLDIEIRADAKVFLNGDFLIGFTSSFRMGQILRYSFVPPKRHSDCDVMQYMATDFVDAVRSALQRGGYARKESDVESAGTFLVGYMGRIFKICSDYQVAELVNDFDAIGCGEAYAKGALYCNCEKTPNDRLTEALLAASYFSAGVSQPFVFLNT